MITKRKEQLLLRFTAKNEAVWRSNSALRALRHAGADGVWMLPGEPVGFVEIDPSKLEVHQASRSKKFLAYLQSRDHTYGLLANVSYVVVLEIAQEQQPVRWKIRSRSDYRFMPISNEGEDDLEDLGLTDEDLNRSIGSFSGVSGHDLALRGSKRAAVAELKLAGCESSVPE